MRNVAADRPRELVSLLQRKGLVMLPVWIALAAVGAMTLAGVRTEGGAGPSMLVFVVAVLLTLALRRLHRHWFGEARLSEPQRIRGTLFGMAILFAFVLTTIVGPRTVPSLMPFVFAMILGSTMLWEPWRVSLQWLVPAAVMLWLSVLHVFGPAWLLRPGIESLLVGVTGAFASLVDHVLMVRRFRRPAVSASGQVSHA